MLLALDVACKFERYEQSVCALLMKRFIKSTLVILLIPVALSLGLLLLKVQWQVEIPMISPAGRIITGGLAEIVVVPLNIHARIHTHIYNLQFYN